MALAKLEKIIATNIRTEEVNLEGMGIDNLAPLLGPLSQLTKLRKLKLAHNNMSGLPEDLSSIKTVEFLDLSANPCSGLSSVIRGLFCLTALRHLYIDLPFESDEDEIIVSLHSLESFNGTPLTENFDEDELMKDNAKSAAPQNATPPVKPQSAWTAPASRPQPNPQSVVTAKTKWEESDMSQVQRMYHAAVSVSGRQPNKSEFDEYTKNVVTHLQSILKAEDDPFRREAEILKAKKIMFEYCFGEVVRNSGRFDANLSQVLSVVQDTFNGLHDNFETLVKNITTDRDRKLEIMRSDMQHAIEEIETMMGQMGGDSARNFEAEKKSMLEEIGWLRSENEKLQAKVRQMDVTRGTAKSGSFSASPSRSALQQPGTKVLTQRQLRDIIEDIYASKSKFDIKCADTHLPRETLEQHMYTYLNQKYGLKHLILEWATAIIQGVKKYSSEDNDVAVFGKILRNEIDEEFRFVQRQLKETVHELLRVYLKGKNPLKGDEDISQMVKKRVAASMQEDEWVDIVKYMYNTEDSVTIIMRIRDIIKQKQAPRRKQTRRAAASNSKEENAIPYAEFLRTLLDFQLEGHDRFLGKFVRLYKQYDSDKNGILNEHEFRQLLRAVDPAKSDDEVSALLDLIDPHNNQLITFSECVTFLSAELVKLSKDGSEF